MDLAQNSAGLGLIALFFPLKAQHTLHLLGQARRLEETVDHRSDQLEVLVSVSKGGV